MPALLIDLGFVFAVTLCVPATCESRGPYAVENVDRGRRLLLLLLIEGDHHAVRRIVGRVVGVRALVV